MTHQKQDRVSEEAAASEGEQGTCVLAPDGLHDVWRRRPQEFRDEGELVDVCKRRKQGSEREDGRQDVGYSRSFPGKRGFPSSISLKMQPTLHMSTAWSYFCHVNMISGAR